MAIDSSIIEKMIIEIVAGIAEENSQYITDAESRKAWQSLKNDCDAIAESGTVVAIEPEWGDKDYDDLYDDDFSSEVDKLLGIGTSLVSKSIGELRYTLGPMYVPDRIDAHNEWTDSMELQKSVWEYVRNGDRRIRLQHNKDIVAGEWVEVMAWPYEVSVPMQKSDGTQQNMTFPKDTVFLGVQWEPWAWELVKAGKLLGYSVGGRAQRLEVDLPISKEEGASPSAPVSGPTVESSHVDTLMGGGKKKKKDDKNVSGKD